jgi:hypothetical protein
MPLVQRRMHDVNNRSIPRAEFDGLLPHGPILKNLMEEQVEWFSNSSGSLLGSIAKGERTAAWKYAILKQDRDGHFHVHKVMNSFLSLNAARVDLLISMAEIAIDQPDLRVPFASAVLPAPH